VLRGQAEGCKGSGATVLGDVLGTGMVRGSGIAGWGLKPLAVKQKTQWISAGTTTIKHRPLSPLADRFHRLRNIGRKLTGGDERV
jgi:hypothetical protein